MRPFLHSRERKQYRVGLAGWEMRKKQKKGFYFCMLKGRWGPRQAGRISRDWKSSARRQNRNQSWLSTWTTIHILSCGFVILWMGLIVMDGFSGKLEAVGQLETSLRVGGCLSFCSLSHLELIFLTDLASHPFANCNHKNWDLSVFHGPIYHCMGAPHHACGAHLGPHLIMGWDHGMGGSIDLPSLDSRPISFYSLI